MTLASVSDFNSAAYDSAFFTVREGGGDRLVLTTGKEAVLRGQRGLLRWLNNLSPADREALVMVTGDASVHHLNWGGSGLPARPDDKIFTTDASVGPITLAVLERFADAHGLADEANAAQRLALSPRDAAAWPMVLRGLLVAGWGTPAIALPTHFNPPPFGRRPPTPRGSPRPLPQVADAIRATGGGAAIPMITRDGVNTHDVAYTPPPSSLVPAGQVATGPVAVVERSHDTLAPLTPDEGGPSGGTGAVLLAVGAAVVAVGLFVAFTRPAAGR